MTGQEARLAAYMLKASKVAGVKMVVPFVLSLPTGDSLQIPALVEEFGGPRGTLVFAESRGLSAKGAIPAGYGVSVLGDRAEDDWDVDSFTDMLREWGWCGAMGEEPEWLARSDLDPVRELTEVEAAPRSLEGSHVTGLSWDCGAQRLALSLDYALKRMAPTKEDPGPSYLVYRAALQFVGVSSLTIGMSGHFEGRAETPQIASVATSGPGVGTTDGDRAFDITFKGATGVISARSQRYTVILMGHPVVSPVAYIASDGRTDGQ